MRSPSLATRALVGLAVCGALAALWQVGRDPARPPPPAPILRTTTPAPCPQRMTRVAPPRCEPVDLGGLIELEVIPHGAHPQTSRPYDGGGFRLGRATGFDLPQSIDHCATSAQAVRDFGEIE